MQRQKRMSFFFPRRLSGGLSGVSEEWLYPDPVYPESFPA